MLLFRFIQGSHDVWSVLEEISLGGFSLICDDEGLDVGLLGEAHLPFSLGALTLQLETNARIVKTEDGRISGKFENLEASKRDVLRYLIGAYLSGELINTNGVVNVLQRESYVWTGVLCFYLDYCGKTNGRQA